MNKPNPIIFGFGARSVGVLGGFMISSISQNRVNDEVSRLTVNLERLFLLVVLCAILGGVAIYVKTQ